jgi:hypothetical protein
MTDEERSGERERERLRSTSRYSVWVGVAFVIVIAIASINTFTNDEGGLLGADARAGEPLPEFAVPELPGGEDADANIFQDDCETSAIPCPADERRTPACDVKLPRVLRVCDYFDRPLVLSFWFTSPAECPPTQDLVDDAAQRYRDRVNFLSVAVRGERAELERIVRESGWSIPIGWDRDGAVSNLYRVGVCPTVAFVLPGGLLREAKIGTEELDRGQLSEAINKLIRDADERAEDTR